DVVDPLAPLLEELRDCRARVRRFEELEAALALLEERDPDAPARDLLLSQGFAAEEELEAPRRRREVPHGDPQVIDLLGHGRRLSRAAARLLELPPLAVLLGLPPVPLLGLLA